MCCCPLTPVGIFTPKWRPHYRSATWWLLPKKHQSFTSCSSILGEDSDWHCCGRLLVIFTSMSSAEEEHLRLHTLRKQCLRKHSVSGNTVSGNTVSGNTVSGNTVSQETQCQETQCLRKHSVSGNTVSQETQWLGCTNKD